MRITMPDWHDQARTLRQQGMPSVQIREILKDSGIDVSESRISQVTGDNWEHYANLDRVKADARREELSKAKKEGRLPDVNAAMRSAAKQYRQERNMAQRQFEPVSIGDPTDRHHRVRIRCAEDDCNESLIFARTGSINPHQAAHWFRDKGWTVGRNERGDLCPTHGKRSKEEPVKVPDLETAVAIPNGAGEPAKKEEPQKVQINLPIDRGFKGQPAPSLPLQAKPKFTPVKPSPQPVVPEEPYQTPTVVPQAAYVPPVPSVPSRTDKRLIHLKLEEVYADEDTGYKDGWTDQRVASDLSVPIEWIAAVRDDSFGPEHGLGLTKIVSGIEERWSRLETSMAFIEDLVRKSDELWKQIDAKLDEYDTQKAELRAMMMEFNRRKN